MIGFGKTGLNAISIPWHLEVIPGGRLLLDYELVLFVGYGKTKGLNIL